MLKKVMTKISIMLAAALMCMQLGGVYAAEMVNVALEKTATYSAPNGLYSGCGVTNALDGDVESLCYFNPNYTTEVYMKVDLGKLYKLSQIKIAARNDIPNTQIETRNIEILASAEDVPLSEMTLLGVTPAEGIGSSGEIFTLDVTDETRYGFVALRKSDTAAMAIAELMVMSDDEGESVAKNVAQGKLIYGVSDTNVINGMGADKLIDGKTSAMYMQGQTGARWVKIDLMNYYEIDEIEIVTASYGDGGETARSADVYVSYDDVEIDKMTYVGGAPAGIAASTSYKVTPTAGQKYKYVAVRRHDTTSHGLFILDEVKVMSKSIPTGKAKHNVALRAPVKFTGAYYAPANAPTAYAPANITDGNDASTVYITDFVNGAKTMIIDLGAPYAITDILVNTGRCYEGTSTNQTVGVSGSLDGVTTTSLGSTGNIPNLAAFTEYTVYTAGENAPRYRYIHLSHGSTNRLFIGEVKVLAEVSEQFGAINFANSAPTAGENLTATVDIANFDTQAPSKQYIFMLAAYDANMNITDISASRLPLQLGKNTLTQSITVPANTVTVKGFLIRSLGDARLLSDIATVTVQ